MSTVPDGTAKLTGKSTCGDEDDGGTRAFGLGVVVVVVVWPVAPVDGVVVVVVVADDGICDVNVSVIEPFGKTNTSENWSTLVGWLSLLFGR